ncbi:hypothetical protein THAOC_27305 [Thalassiosira oceanica]|uniref:Uncharacterized protein n=1 Tax=Thalassiosira oceanica TaxID=159749 RepID=K0S329_THAOC|nr:hypothetical protein THAOC_27305 [Thalassiosira oceanica]|eukprot:EJK53292.1 hypothetical protein THAOC_27305 [Thalassiosira oceanica]
MCSHNADCSSTSFALLFLLNSQTSTADTIAEDFPIVQIVRSLFARLRFDSVLFLTPSLTLHTLPMPRAARFLLKLPRGFHKGTHGSQAEEARARSGGVWFGFAVFAPPLKRMVPSRICSLCWVVSRARYLVTYVAGTCRDPVRTETEPRTLGGSFAQQLSLSFRSECPCTGRRDGIQSMGAPSAPCSNLLVQRRVRADTDCFPPRSKEKGEYRDAEARDDRGERHQTLFIVGFLPDRRPLFSAELATAHGRVTPAKFG